MSQLFQFDKPILSIEPYDPEKTEGYDDFEWPGGYYTTEGKKIAHKTSNMSVVTVMISPNLIAKCPVDNEVMQLSEEQKVKIVMGGKDVACLVNTDENRYVCFNKPLRRKYNTPRVVAGINMALVAAVAGYILAIILKHQKAKMGLVIVEGGAFFLFIGSIIYAFYYFTNDADAHIKLRQYIKKILK